MGNSARQTPPVVETIALNDPLPFQPGDADGPDETPHWVWVLTTADGAAEGIDIRAASLPMNDAPLEPPKGRRLLRDAEIPENASAPATAAAACTRVDQDAQTDAIAEKIFAKMLAAQLAKTEPLRRAVVSMHDAAELLGISYNALRKRVEKHTFKPMKAIVPANGDRVEFYADMLRGAK